MRCGVKARDKNHAGTHAVPITAQKLLTERRLYQSGLLTAGLFPNMPFNLKLA